MLHTRARLGSAGEDLAAEYLRGKGYAIIARNVRTRVGELDIVCLAPRHTKFWRRREVVFVEVKTRRSLAFGTPAEAVTRVKQQHLVRAAHAYLAGSREFRRAPFRIDVIAIMAPPNGAPEITHFPSAVGAI
ncbi:YraN family protein [Candidatus Uhrbacteria bacterium]|nr:YraN family protein [Candidatus Uhrbacteria bacterium]